MLHQRDLEAALELRRKTRKPLLVVPAGVGADALSAHHLIPHALASLPMQEAMSHAGAERVHAPYNRTGGVTQTPCEKLGVRGARHNPPNPRSFFCSQPSCDTVNKFVSETVLPNSFRTPTEPAWGHPRGVDQVKLRVLEASLVQGEG